MPPSGSRSKHDWHRLGFFRDGFLPHRPEDLPADARERAPTELAARVMRQVAKDPLRLLQGLVALHQAFLPVNGL